MKIDDVTLTLFAWDDIPATIYGGHTGEFRALTFGFLTLKPTKVSKDMRFLGRPAELPNTMPVHSCAI